LVSWQCVSASGAESAISRSLAREQRYCSRRDGDSRPRCCCCYLSTCDGSRGRIAVRRGAHVSTPLRQGAAGQSGTKACLGLAYQSAGSARVTIAAVRTPCGHTSRTAERSGGRMEGSPQPGARDGWQERESQRNAPSRLRRVSQRITHAPVLDRTIGRGRPRKQWLDMYIQRSTIHSYIPHIAGMFPGTSSGKVRDPRLVWRICILSPSRSFRLAVEASRRRRRCCCCCCCTCDIPGTMGPACEATETQ